MRYRNNLGYIALGGALMLVGMLAANLTPLTAQKTTGKRITCTELNVIDSEGYIKVRLTDSGVYAFGIPVYVSGKNASGVEMRGGSIIVSGKRGKGRIEMQAYKDGGRLSVFGTKRYGGIPLAVMSVDGDGNGAVNTWDEKGNRLATLK